MRILAGFETMKKRPRDLERSLHFGRKSLTGLLTGIFFLADFCKGTIRVEDYTFEV